MNVSVSTSGTVTTVRLAGEIDTYTVPEVRTVFDRLGLAPERTVVVDLSGVTFLDSSGLGAVIGLHRWVGAAGARLQLVCGEVTLRLIRLMNLDQVIDVVESVDASVEGNDSSAGDDPPSAEGQDASSR